jgi:outer membrane immunogenic protein
LARTSARGGSFIGGALVGHDWRVGPLVLGLVGDVSGARAVNYVNDPFGTAIRSELGVQGSLRGRVGYAFNRLLVYATGGFNIADVRHDYRTALVSGSRHLVVAEPTVGVGMEYALTDRWSGLLEYRLSGVGTPRETSPVLESTIVRHDAGAATITAGVSYHFGR